jgi:hypothetical protein
MAGNALIGGNAMAAISVTIPELEKPTVTVITQYGQLFT